MPNQKFTYRLLASASLLFVCATLVHATSITSEEKESQIRAAFLLNFMKFTIWPEEAFVSNDVPLVLAIVGRDPFGRTLEQTFSNEQVQRRRIDILRLPLPKQADYRTTREYDAAVARFREQLHTAHITYFANCDSDDLEFVLKQVDTRFMLTVGDARGCAVHHTALALDRDGSRIVFYANVQSLNGLDIQVSSRLLSLARIIDPDRSGR